MRYVVVVAVFATTLVISNIIAVKQVEVLGFFRVSAADAMFPVTYIVGDILTEVYGFRRARSAIWVGFGCNALAVTFILIGQAMPGADFWKDQPAYDTILGLAPRLLLASFVAYFVGEMSNSMIMAKLKVATKGRFLWSRTISSTLVGEGLDTLVFTLIAFAGTGIVPDMERLILTVWLYKVSYEVIATPITYAVCNYLKRSEGVDVYDSSTPIFGRGKRRAALEGAAS